VRNNHAGFDVLWIVECKAWKRAVPKERVLALRSVVQDIGADRGLLMAESGYQSGALEAAANANVMLTSLADLKELAACEIGVQKLQSVLDRVESCNERYWSMSKSHRIDHGLRPEGGLGIGYMGDMVIRAVRYAATDALRHGFPVRYDRTRNAMMEFAGRRRDDSVEPSEAGAILDASRLYEVLDHELRELEALLDTAEQARPD
jgi:hypothetical protein